MLDVLEEEKVLAQFFLGDQVGGLVIVFRQLPHGPDVTFLRAFGQAFKLETLDHSLSQFGHGYTSRLKLESSIRKCSQVRVAIENDRVSTRVVFSCAQRLVQQVIRADASIAWLSSDFLAQMLGCLSLGAGEQQRSVLPLVIYLKI